MNRNSAQDANSKKNNPALNRARGRARVEKQCRQRPPRLDQIRKGVGVQNSQKSIGCVTQGAAQYAGALDPAIACLIKATDDVEPVLGLAHHLADIDVAWLAHETNAAATSADRIETFRLRSLTTFMR